MMKNTILYLLIALPYFCFAQEVPINTVKENGKHFKAIEIIVKKNTFYTQIIPNFTSSSLSIETDVNNSLDGSYILLGGVEKFILSKDKEQTENIQESTQRINYQSTSLYIAKQEFPFFSFYSGQLEGKVRINLMYASSLKSKYLRDKKKSPNDCNTKPESIDQSIWRVGLPNPAPNPLYSQVKHIILHHAAGSNSDTDYINTVRNYYLLHTQTNGWDDIGYNYLVAPNGDIYDGRQGDSLGDDNVIGAHMCARNTNTMGICLLGNYEVANVYPTDTAINSINDLITWKLWKEQLLNPYDSSLHPVLNPILYLGVIAGHKQGCASGYTSCPGKNYFDIIEPRVKAATAIRLANCLPNGIQVENPKKILVYPNPFTEGILHITSPEPIQGISIINILGQLVYENIDNTNEYTIEISKSDFADVGTYLVRVKTGDKFYYQSLIISQQ